MLELVLMPYGLVKSMLVVGMSSGLTPVLVAGGGGKEFLFVFCVSVFFNMFSFAVFVFCN